MLVRPVLYRKKLKMVFPKKWFSPPKMVFFSWGKTSNWLTFWWFCFLHQNQKSFLESYFLWEFSCGIDPIKKTVLGIKDNRCSSVHSDSEEQQICQTQIKIDLCVLQQFKFGSVRNPLIGFASRYHRHRAREEEHRRNHKMLSGIIGLTKTIWLKIETTTHIIFLADPTSQNQQNFKAKRV